MKNVILFVVIGAWASSPVFSEEQKIVELIKKIEQLENRVAILEKVIAEQSNSNLDGSNKIPADRKAWRKIRKGMNPEEVRKLLGEPLTISGGGITSWYYSESLAHSWVAFTDRDGLRAWSEPE